jgi:hypothetical protein
MVSSSLSSGPCAYSSMLEVSTTGILRMRADFASINALRLSSSKGMDLAHPIVPIWWSMSSIAEFSAVNRSKGMVKLLYGKVAVDYSGRPANSMTLALP